MFYSGFSFSCKIIEWRDNWYRSEELQTVKSLEKKNNHLDPNSYLVVVRSKDGEHWTKEPNCFMPIRLEAHKIHVC